MKKVIIILCSIPFFTSSGYVTPGGNRTFPQEIKEKEPDVNQPIVLPIKPIGDLINALIYVESRGLDSAIGDTHLDQPSVGVLQIRPIMVREVNRICKRIGSHQRFTLKDRFDRSKSVHMFLIWKEFHHKNSDFESIARSWNGGPKGPKSSRTLPYWEKVEKQLNIKNN